MGVGAPNHSRVNGKTMCAIVLTRDMGFIRVYPIPANESFPVWANVEVDMQRGSDTRAESYKLLDWSIGKKIEYPTAKREILNACICKSGYEDPLAFSNYGRASICLVKPGFGSVGVSVDQRIPAPVREDDGEFGWLVTQGRHWSKPYLTWKSEQDREHKSHLGGREIYEGLRNNPHKPWDLMNNLQINNADWEHWFLLGNMKNRRNVWLVVHLHRLKKTTDVSTPLFSHPIIGDGDQWPYSKQETSNVSIAGGHPELFTMSDMTSGNFHGNMTIIN